MDTACKNDLGDSCFENKAFISDVLFYKPNIASNSSMSISFSTSIVFI
jgi:hypothetical protein